MLSENSILWTALSILLLPLLSYAIIFFFGKKLPRKGDWVGVSLLFVSWVQALRIFFAFWQKGDPQWRVEGSVPWLKVGDFVADAGILVDGTTAVMLVVVTTVSMLVHLFSTGYMHGDRRYERFFAFLGFFTFSMMGIVLSNSLLFLYIFWELVGLASYLLIGFFFHKHSAANANKKAFLTNRVGDFGFFMGIMIFFTAYGTFNYMELFAQMQTAPLTGALLTWAGVGLFMGCVGKSAQAPLHIWLPDAMEGPTPVSALIHAATMVAAGVYMVARLQPLFDPQALLVVAYVGSITAFMAATIAVVKTDIKKSLAYSTISQLGYMVMAIGVGAAGAGMFHLWTHAFFKALLFLGSGSVIHAVHTQEMPLMGGLRKKMPITYATFLIATIAIAGVPFFSGFYSKDAILAGALAFGWTEGHMLPFILGMAAAAFTAFYMFRMLFLTFHGKPRDEERFHHAHESPFSMAFPLVFLSVLAIGSAGWQGPTDGWFGKFVAPYDLTAIAAEHGGAHAAADAHHAEADHAAVESHGGGEGEAHGDAHAADAHAAPAHGDAHGETHADAAHGGHDDHHDVHHKAHVTAMFMSIAVAGLAILMSWLVYMRGLIDTERFKARLAPVHTVLQNMYFFDELYAATVYRFTLWFSWLNAAFDRTVIDGIVNGFGYLTRVVSWFAGQVDRFGVDGLVNGVGAVVQFAGEGVRRVHTGRIQTYLAYVSFSVLVLVLVFRAL
ncbi:MAG TPA: NADH-quinone oxidoreductase subunit L [Candidatus Krumholzibacteria bacterium]|nr:NADH-quinone oxidoreductase subunit L [Candidatus Krumholzibacteria bacterium]HRX52551.1 NADH-quinone oxidoreductase subunit L [Candidatus Krumholzibacteria bacterium]